MLGAEIDGVALVDYVLLCLEKALRILNTVQISSVLLIWSIHLLNAMRVRDEVVFNKFR